MLDEELGTNLFKPILFLVTCLQVVADEEKRRQARWNLKRVRTQNGGDFHVHVALREAMHDRRIADIERASLRVRSAQGKATSFTIHPLITDGHAESSLISAGMLLVPDGAGTCKTHTSGGQEGHAGAFCVLARQVAS